MKLLGAFNFSNKITAALSSISVLVAFIAMPAHAEDKTQRDALLEAALQRITALEAKVGRINSLEDENRQLRSKLIKVAARSDAAIKVSKISITSSKLDNRQAAPLNTGLPISNNSDLASKRTLWEGFYAGINAGYGTNNITNYTNTLGIDNTSTLQTMANSYNTSYVGGAVAGGQFGYNHVFANRMLVGGEADFNWADVYNNTAPNNSGSVTLNHSNTNNPFAFNTEVQHDYTSTYARLGMDFIGTVRARLGYDMGRFLPYVTAGLAYGALSNNSHTLEQSVAYEARFPGKIVYEPVGSSTIKNASVMSAGWTLGAGAEYFVADGWSMKGEYLYTSIGGITAPQISRTATLERSAPTDIKEFITQNTGSFGVHQVRVGLNYHPGWNFSEPVLTAK